MTCNQLTWWVFGIVPVAFSSAGIAVMDRNPALGDALIVASIGWATLTILVVRYVK